MYSDALAYHIKALKINEKYLPKFHQYLGLMHNNLATVYRYLGDCEVGFMQTSV